MALPPLNALRAFEAAARLKSFKAAADALFVTQSAVSHQIRHLEDFLRVPLFDRSGARPRLMPAGQELARTLSLSFGTIDAACQRIAQGRQERVLVIAAIPSVAICWLIPRLARFRDSHPEVALRVVYAIHGHEIDFSATHLAFVYADRAPSLAGVQTLGFLSGACVPVCSPRLLPKAPTVGQIMAAGLLHDTDRTGWSAWLAQAGASLGPQDPGPLFEDFNLLRAAALAGQGMALCPLAMIRDDLQAGRLVQLSADPVLDQFDYYLLAREGLPPALAADAAAFRAWAFAERDAG